MVQKLEQYAINTSDTALSSYLSSILRDKAMHDSGIGTMHNMKSVFTGVFIPVMRCRAYTLGEKINIWRGKAFLNNSTNLRSQMYSTDLTVEVPKLDVPTYFLSGIYDYTVNYNLAKEYSKKIQAPVKGFYTFEQSAHSPHFEEPEKFMHILLEDVLKGKSEFADKE